MEAIATAAWWLRGQAAWAELDALFLESGLAGAPPADISVSLFQVVQGGTRYAVLYEAYEESGETHEHVMLEPNDVMFHPPWESGEFST